MDATRRFLEQMGLPPGDLHSLPSSTKRFPDGAQYRVEIPELVRIAAPVYLKFGLRNAPNIYPVGKHIESVSIALSRERVRRARIGLDLLARYYSDAIQSEAGAPGLAIPVQEDTL